MIRIMGFVTGSAIAVAAMLLVLGMPEIPPPEPIVEDLPADGPVAMPIEPDVAPQAPQPPPLAETDPALEPPPEQHDQPIDQPLEQPLVAVADEPLPDDLKWHAFWSPFGSQIAANGFVSRLEAVTGFDYRVVKVETGVYEVAFAYADDTELDTKLETISAATGLEIPGS